MNAKIHRVFIALVLLAICNLYTQLSTAHAQGSLTPPGAPAPTMLTLSQIEPRTPVDATHTGSGGSSEFLITQPGSYYLTTNVVGVSGIEGINISANNVTLDLNGFSVLGISGAWSGIFIHAGYTNVTVRNGNISGWANTSLAYGGVECYANNVILERLNVSANHYGIYLASSGVVRDCNCYNNTGIAIQVNAGTVSGCEVLNNAANGIYVATGTVSDCVALTNANYGIYVWTNCTVKDCTSDNNYDGVHVGDNCTVKDCTASGNNDDGVNVGNNCTVKDCTASGNNYGIYVSGRNSRIAGNTCCFNSFYGIYIDGIQNRIDNNIAGYNTIGIYELTLNSGNTITRNSAPGNSSFNYFNTTGNSDFAPIQSPNTATSPWANF